VAQQEQSIRRIIQERKALTHHAASAIGKLSAARMWSRDGVTGELKIRDWKAMASAVRKNHSRTAGLSAVVVRSTKDNVDRNDGCDDPSKRA